MTSDNIDGRAGRRSEGHFPALRGMVAGLVRAARGGAGSGAADGESRGRNSYGTVGGCELHNLVNCGRCRPCSHCGAAGAWVRPGLCGDDATCDRCARSMGWQPGELWVQPEDEPEAARVLDFPTFTRCRCGAMTASPDSVCGPCAFAGVKPHDYGCDVAELRAVQLSAEADDALQLAAEFGQDAAGDVGLIDFWQGAGTNADVCGFLGRAEARAERCARMAARLARQGLQLREDAAQALAVVAYYRGGGR